MKWVLYVLFFNGADVSGLPVKSFPTLAECRAAARDAASTLSFNSKGLACLPRLGEVKLTTK